MECPSHRKSIPRRCHRSCPSLRLGPGSAAPLPLFSPTLRRTGLWSRCRSARLRGQVWSRSRLLLEEATRERGLAGAWEAGTSLPCPAASQTRDPRHRKVPVAAGGQSTAGAIGGENEQGYVLFCVGFHRTESRSSSPAGERVYDSNMSLLSYLHPPGSLYKRTQQQTVSRGIFI